jgi:hypothetical protein
LEKSVFGSRIRRKFQVYRPNSFGIIGFYEHWQVALRSCGYVQSRQATSQSLMSIPHTA